MAQAGFLAGVASPPSLGAGVPAPGAESNREDLLDFVLNLDKEKAAAVFVAAPKTVANGMNHEWLTEGLPATATGGRLEGNDWGSATATMSARTRLANAVQTLQFDFSVSMDQVEYSRKGRTPGVANEYEHQVQNHLLVLEQSVDARAVALGTSVASVSASASSVSALMGAIRNWQTSATAATGTLQSGANVNYSLNISGAWSRARYLQLHEAMFTAGANPNTLAVDPGVKSDITTDILGEDATAGRVRQVHFDSSQTEFTQDIQYMRTDYGRVAILVDRFIPTAALSTANALAGGAFFLYDRAKVRFAFWRPMRHYPIPPTGDYFKGYVHCGVTLEELHPKTVGIGYNVTT